MLFVSFEGCKTLENFMIVADEVTFIASPVCECGYINVVRRFRDVAEFVKSDWHKYSVLDECSHWDFTGIEGGGFRVSLRISGARVASISKM